MKVAIIGAGISGLSCAHELERYGISPDIYEDLDFIGDREEHITCTLEIVDRPIKNTLQYFENICNLNIQPINMVKKLTHYSENAKAVIKGNNFGYFFNRSKDADSAKGQLYSQLKSSKVYLGQKPDYKKLAEEYDFVVVATILPDVAKDFGYWTSWIDGWIKGAVVHGEFDPNELIMWLNRKYCKSGYAYLCPFDSSKASLAIFVPFVNERQLEYYWRRFLKLAEIKYEIVEEFAVKHYSGNVFPHKINNIYLVGGSGGGISPLLGFGFVNSVTMGVLAARSIIEGLDYETLIKFIVDKTNYMNDWRKAFDTLNNKNFDKILKIINLSVIKHLIYFTPIDIIKGGAELIRLKRKIFKKL